MLAVQVLEKTPFTDSSYPQEMTSGELALLWLNGQIWKIKNPEIPLILYTDPQTFDFLSKFDILDSWHSINTELLSEDIGIDKSTFWSNSKLRVYNDINQPFLFYDCDLLIWDDIKKWEIFDYDLITSYKEDLSLNCYLEPEKILSEFPINLISDWKNMPLNASFVYLNNENLKKRYVDISLDWMKGCSENKKNLNKFSVFFIEQRLLAELADSENIKQKTLLKNYNTDKGWNKIELVDGLWTAEDSYNHVFHMGYEKICLRKNTEHYNEKYLDFFVNYIKKNCKEKGLEHLIPKFLELAFLY